MPESINQMPGGPAVPGATPSPSATPSGKTVEPAGEIEMAKANVSIAIAMLEKQLPLLGTDSEEGAVVLKALTMLSKKFSSKKSEDLAPAELMSVMNAQPDAYKQAMMKEMGPGAQGPVTGVPGAQVTPPQFA